MFYKTSYEYLFIPIIVLVASGISDIMTCR